MEVPGFWELLKLQLAQPEYQHVLLNPLPIYGLALGLLAGAAAWALRSRKAEWLALGLLFLCALSAWPVAELGEKAADNVSSLADPAGQAWLEEHEETAHKALPLFFTAAALALAAALAPLQWPRSRRPLYLAALLAGLAAFAAGAWIGYLGGKVRHKEFRYGPPPETAPNRTFNEPNR